MHLSCPINPPPRSWHATLDALGHLPNGPRMLWDPPATHGRLVVMCGRYASARNRQELLGEFDVQRDACDDELEPDYNVAPTKPVPAVLARGSRDGGESIRELRTLRWGLVPSWAKDLSIGNRLINARVETVPAKPAFRDAFARRRCLLPADGYYEWYPVAQTGRETGSKPRKQPFFIRPRNGGGMAMAGLFERWRDPADDAWWWTCTVITTGAVDDIGRIHDRMPMLVEPARWAAWLDPAQTDPGQVRDLLVPAAAGWLEAYPVSSAVSNVKNNGPELTQPLRDKGSSGEYAPTLF